jgi:hypothetical protein
MKSFKQYLRIHRVSNDPDVTAFYEAIEDRSEIHFILNDGDLYAVWDWLCFMRRANNSTSRGLHIVWGNYCLSKHGNPLLLGTPKELKAAKSAAAVHRPAKPTKPSRDQIATRLAHEYLRQRREKIKRGI